MSVINVLSVARHFSRNNHILKQIHCCSVYLHYSSKQSCLGYSREESVQLQQKKLIPAHTNQILSYTSRRWFSSPPKSTSDGDLIYTGNLGKAVLGVKFFSYSSSMFSLCLMPYILTKTGLGVSSLALKVAFCGFIGFFTFLTPVLLHLVTKGYVVRLYHDRHTDVYTAVTYNALLVEKKTVFHQSDVAVPDVSRMFTSFYAKKRSMLVNPELFQIPHDYNHLMGYDRPFSFDLDEINKPDRR